MSATGLFDRSIIRRLVQRMDVALSLHDAYVVVAIHVLLACPEYGTHLY